LTLPALKFSGVITLIEKSHSKLVSVTDKLFGDDLQKKIENIQKSKNITVAGFSDKTTGNGPYNKTTGNFSYNNRQ
jgi:hypothetical protein